MQKRFATVGISVEQRNNGDALNSKLTRRASLGAIASVTGGLSIADAKAATAIDQGGRVSFRSTLYEISRMPSNPGFVYLLDEGKAGLFSWDGSNCSKLVAADPKQGIFVAPDHDSSGTSGAWRRIVENDLHITWFGAKFDVGDVERITEASDDSDAWEAALAYLAAFGGGTLRLPSGASKVTRQITISDDAIRIVGTGTRKVYPGKFSPGSPCPSTLVPVHGERNAIRFIAKTSGAGGFQAENFNLATLESGQMPVAAFGWETAYAFGYGFAFRQLGIFGFASAFDVYHTQGNEMAVGAVEVENCVINRNRWIARCLDKTLFNSFSFTNNRAGQNGYLIGQGGIAISGHNININQNILEGTRNPIQISGGYRSIIVQGNYFEANVGNACIELIDIWGPYSVGPNNYAILDYSKVDHKVLLKFCGFGHCLDPYWPCGVHKLSTSSYGGVPTNSLNNRLDSASSGFFRADSPSSSWLNEPPYVAVSAGLTGSKYERAPNPITGEAMPVQKFRTSHQDYLAHTATLVGRMNDWVVMSWLLRRVDDGGAAADPYVSMKVNGAGVGGSRDYVMYNFHQAWREGEWCLITAAIRLKIAMSSLQILLYPYGIKAEQGREIQYLPPVAYTVENINDAAPYIVHRTMRSVTSPPKTGEWFVGDTLDNAQPSPSANRFVCVTSGSPGTWISA